MREAGNWPKTNSVFRSMILPQVTIQQRHVPRKLYVKNVRTITQLPFKVISTKSRTSHQQKMMMGKRKKLKYQIDPQKQKISAMLPLTKELVWSVCVLFQ